MYHKRKYVCCSDHRVGRGPTDVYKGLIATSAARGKGSEEQSGVHFIFYPKLNTGSLVHSLGPEKETFNYQ